MAGGGERHDENDGSDIFWPGYVDATTNLILNLLFLVTILIVAVFMFALELGRSSQVEAAKQEVDVAGKPEINLARKLDFTEEMVPGVEKVKSPQDVNLVQENVELKEEVKRLKLLLARKTSEIDLRGGGDAKTYDASIDLPEPTVGLDETKTNRDEIVVRFKKEAIAFTDEERSALLSSLKPIVDSGSAVITVAVPDGFSEAKRIAYYRAMEVRNLLLEMEMPGDKINVTVLEVEKNGDAALVKVK